MDIIIVCHTEFGFVSGKKIIFDKKAIQGVTLGVPNLLKVAEQYDAKITFAVCPEVAPFFPKRISHEIGLHVHPGWEEFRAKNFSWHVGDSYLKEKIHQGNTSTVLQDHSYADQLALIQAGKEYIENLLGAKLASFVAGRWSLNNDTVRALIETGFTHDASAVPGAKTSYLDWSRLPRLALPYHPNKKDYQAKGDMPLLMLPVSRALFGVSMNPESAALCGFSWLKACFLEYYGQGAPFFQIALHSCDMTDPFYSSIMEKLLSFISKHSRINFTFASEIKPYTKEDARPNVVPYLGAGSLELAVSGFKKFLRIVAPSFLL